MAPPPVLGLAPPSAGSRYPRCGGFDGTPLRFHRRAKSRPTIARLPTKVHCSTPNFRSGRPRAAAAPRPWVSCPFRIVAAKPFGSTRTCTCSRVRYFKRRGVHESRIFRNATACWRFSGRVSFGHSLALQGMNRAANRFTDLLLHCHYTTAGNRGTRTGRTGRPTARTTPRSAGATRAQARNQPGGAVMPGSCQEPQRNGGRETQARHQPGRNRGRKR